MTPIKTDPRQPHTLRHLALPACLLPMSIAVSHRRLWSGVALSRAEVLSCLDAVMVLKQTTAQLDRWRPLQGRHVALLCAASSPAADVMSRAISALGGRAALLDYGSWPRGGARDLPSAAQMLGLLYDAVDCCDLPPADARQVEQHAGVPVFDGLARDDHSLGLLVELATMREVSDRPLDQLQVQLKGNPGLPLHGAAASLCRAAGIVVRSAGLAQRLRRAGGTVRPANAEFVLDPSAPPPKARLSMPSATSSEQARIEALLAENRPRTLQALIVMALH